MLGIFILGVLAVVIGAVLVSVRRNESQRKIKTIVGASAAVVGVCCELRSRRSYRSYRNSYDIR